MYLIDNHLSILRQAAEHAAHREFTSARSLLHDYVGKLQPDEHPEDLQCLIFANALCSHLGQEPIKQANLYLRNYDVPQIRLFNLLATKFPPARLAAAIANEILARCMEGRRKVVVMDIGIGTGRQIAELIQRLVRRGATPEQMTIIGLEPNAPALREAEKVLAEAGREAGIEIVFRPVLGLVEQLPEEEWARLQRTPDDLLINASFAVHHVRGLASGPEPRARLFRKLHTLRPAILVLSEPNSDHNEENAAVRLENAWHHFGLVFGLIDELDIALADKRALKVCFFGREIEDILGTNERIRSERHEALERWESRLSVNGFIPALPEGIASTLSDPLVRLNEQEWHVGLDFRDGTIAGVIAAAPAGEIDDEPWPATEEPPGYLRDEPETFDPRAYLSALVRIAQADESVPPAERDFIDQQARLLGVDLPETWQLADYCRGRELPPLTRRTRLALVRDCIVVAKLDGNYTEQERAKTQEIAGRLALTPDDIAVAEEDARVCMPPFLQSSPPWLREYWGILEKGGSTASI